VAHALIGIIGPTASGKSELALRLAREWPAEIVSCDSLQVYRGLDIGSAKPAREELDEIPHHLIDVVDLDQSFSAADYAALARSVLSGIVERRRLPILAGGAGLYLRALLEGLFPGPSRHPIIRARFEALADRYGNQGLHRMLRRVDPEAAARIAMPDRVRIVRALEVFWLTGRPISEWQRENHGALQGFDTHLVGLNPPRDELRQRVSRRARAMLQAGLIQEVLGLLERGCDCGIRPLQAIGYREALAHIQGRIAAEQLLPSIINATMRYAKRQMTWFRNQIGAEWHTNLESAYASVSSWLHRRIARDPGI
jgi:tRNA dimethylallyltransferase